MVTIDSALKIGLAGCDAAGCFHAGVFSGIDEIELVACYDAEYEKALDAAEQYGLKSAYNSINQMLDEATPDALVVTVTGEERLTVVAEALKRGIHVFCEIPMAPGYAEAVELTKIVRENELVAMLNFSKREIPAVSAALDFVREGNIGSIRYFEISYIQNLSLLTDSEFPGGALGELAPHLYDLAQQFCGDFSDLSCLIRKNSAGNSDSDFTDYTVGAVAGDSFTSQICFRNGAVGTINGSLAAGCVSENFRISVYGDNGFITVEPGADENSFIYVSGSGTVEKELPVASPEKLHDQFLSAIKGESSLIPDFEYGLKIQYYLEQSRISDEGGLRMGLE